jgi:peptide chain release factor 1
MYEKLKSIVWEYETLRDQLYNPEVFGDQWKLKVINRQLKSQEKLYELAIQYIKASDQLAEAKQILETESDPDMMDLAKGEIADAQSKLEPLEEAVKEELLPKDPNDDKDIYLEIRPAAGGDEAWLFASELLRAYLAYAQAQWWKTEIEDQQLSDTGGIKIAIVKIMWDRVYSRMKFESWVHRVQRIPVTESNWRVHTSTITVAIMPEAEEVDIQIDPNDVIMDTYAASSAGGQNANKNQTWVRLHHKPTGMIVTIGDSKSQLHNKDKAWAVLRSRIYQIEYDKKMAETKEARGSQIGGWDRSEKIRTYNYPQDRVTDHRIKQSWSWLPIIMAGAIWPIVEALILAAQQWVLGSGDDDD